MNGREASLRVVHMGRIPNHDLPALRTVQEIWAECLHPCPEWPLEALRLSGWVFASPSGSRRLLEVSRRF